MKKPGLCQQFSKGSGATSNMYTHGNLTSLGMFGPVALKMRSFIRRRRPAVQTSDIWGGSRLNERIFNATVLIILMGERLFRVYVLEVEPLIRVPQ